jgi:hypothetical protein
MSYIIRIGLTILLIGCLFKVPYGYFTFVKIASCIGFLYLAFTEFESRRQITGTLCVLCAILLNPIFKIHFTRKTWNLIDEIIAGLLILWVIIDLILMFRNRNSKIAESI